MFIVNKFKSALLSCTTLCSSFIQPSTRESTFDGKCKSDRQEFVIKIFIRSFSCGFNCNCGGRKSFKRPKPTSSILRNPENTKTVTKFQHLILIFAICCILLTINLPADSDRRSAIRHRRSSCDVYFRAHSNVCKKLSSVCVSVLGKR